jgi:hypothetical protein
MHDQVESNSGVKAIALSDRLVFIDVKPDTLNGYDSDSGRRKISIKRSTLLQSEASFSGQSAHDCFCVLVV